MRSRILPWAAVAGVFWLALFPIGSVDAYYHLATGLRILDERAIPTRGVGSATFGQAPWHDNEWGFQVITALVGRSERDPSGVLTLTPSGRAGLVVMRAASCAATMAALAATMLRGGAGPGMSALGVWLAAFLTFGNLFWDVRPQIASFLAVAVLVDLLDRFRRGARWALPASLALLALWSNLHGAVVVGCVVLACEAAGAWLGEDRRRAGWLTAAAAAGPLAASLNPLGWRQLAYALDYARRPEITAGNTEWTRPDLLHLPLLMLTVGLLAAAIAAGARPRWGALIRVAAFGGLFLSAIRHLPYFVIVLVPVTVQALTEAARLGGARRFLHPRGPAALAAAAAVVVALSGARWIGLVPRFTERPSRPLPEAQVRYLARHGVEGAGFNAYRFGGFLMFRLYPGERVVMDGRNDLYREFRTDVYNRILYTQPGWEPLWNDLVARHRIRWVLLDATDPLAGTLAGLPGWTQVPDRSLAGDPSGIVMFLAQAQNGQD